MDQILDIPLGALEVVYGRPVFAFFALIVMFVIAGLMWFRAEQRVRPYLIVLRRRIEALKKALGTEEGPESERASFAENYIEVAAALGEPAPSAQPLVQAWREFQESILDENASPIRNTTRPNSFFVRARPRLSGLIFASNVFVAAGLILTFIGLVVALRTAGRNMGDAAHAQTALQLLLTVASAKFLTSIGGIGASLMLRVAEQGMSRKCLGGLDELSELLERGLLYVPPQRLAAQQLDQLEQQTAQLKSFNTDFALQLSERMGMEFQQAIAPVTDSLASLNTHMSTMGSSIRDSLDGGAAKAVSESAGAELRALGATLANLGEQLAQLGSSVGSSGDAAAQQIRQAGADFAEAARDIRGAFESLVGQVDGLGTKLTAQGDSVAKGLEDTITRALSGMEAAQSRTSTQLETASQALISAGASAAANMQREVEGALSAAFSDGQARFRDALEEGGEALRETTTGLAKSVETAAEKVQLAATEFARSADGAERASESLSRVSEGARLVATSLGDASRNFIAAGEPVGRAAEVIGAAATKLAKTVEDDRAAAADALDELTALAEEITKVQEAAAEAWASYRGRFEGVDRALGDAMSKLKGGLDDALGAQGEFVQKFDAELAKAVGKLSKDLDVVADQSDQLEGVADQMGRAAKALELAANRLSSPAMEAAE